MSPMQRLLREEWVAWRWYLWVLSSAVSAAVFTLFGPSVLLSFPRITLFVREGGLQLAPLNMPRTLSIFKEL